MRNNLNLQNHPLSNYFERLATDPRLFSSHIALFAALFYFSNDKCPCLSFQVSRPKLMRFSRIKSIATYHKNISDLVHYGYIEYNPSWHPLKGTRVRLIIEN
ncbi:hypothetical protein [Pedobacter foliorum]|uniref:hypothetical protein n=1 Tax=Pedobacter foliorum TaxID=2739058 RepID=UPI001567A44F|nr:hypothetical protein [Pedobacter foliorum]NRF40227.1 hypothetical protein [Pedobacter foliorum]